MFFYSQLRPETIFNAATMTPLGQNQKAAGVSQGAENERDASCRAGWPTYSAVIIDLELAGIWGFPDHPLDREDFSDPGV